VLRSNVPLPADGESNQYFFRDRTGKILLKQFILSGRYLGKLSLHGPARVEQGPHGYCDMATTSSTMVVAEMDALL
jgi:hypothetical protein